MADYVARNYQLLNLGGAFVDAEYADIPVETLNAMVGKVSRAAKYLYRSVRNPACHLTAKHFAARGFGADVFAGIAAAGRHPTNKAFDSRTSAYHGGRSSRRWRRLPAAARSAGRQRRLTVRGRRAPSTTHPPCSTIPSVQ